MRLEIPYFKQSTSYSCGPTVVQMILAYYGVTESERDLVKILKTNERTGTSHRNLVKIFKERGFYCCEKKNGTWDDVKNFIEKGVPLVVNYIEPSDDEGHYAIVVSVTNNSIILNDPWNGRKFRMEKNEFLKRWRSQHSHTRGWFVAVSTNEFSSKILH